MYSSAARGPQESVIYFGSSPDITKYAKGSRSWRTNNPGLVSFCLETRQLGAIGQVLGVAVFQNPEQGRRALQAMLGREELAGQTVASVLQRYISNYTPPPREADPTGEPGPWNEPETGVDLELTMSAVSGADRQALANLIERRIGYHPGVITHEPYDTGTFNTAKRNPGASPGNMLINGRSSVHAGSGGTVTSPDICETPSGHGCKSVMYTNVAKSADAAQTATTVKVNGHPVCTLDSIFSRSTGDEGGRCGGVRSGTIKGQAEFVTATNNYLIEGQRAVRQFDQMTSNYQNTPFTPLMQPGGARPPFLDAVGAQTRGPGPTPWRFDWRIAAGPLKQLSGRWALISGPAFGQRQILGRPITIGTRHQQGNGYWNTEMVAPLEGACGYALELPEANPTGDTPPSYFIPFDHLGLGRTRPYDVPPKGEEIAVPVVIGLYGSEARDSTDLALPELGRDAQTEQLRKLSKDKDSQGWLYVYVNGHLWRELEVKGLDRGMRSYADVNLTTHQAQDVRPASGQTVNHLLLPHQVGGKRVKVEIAYARVQWSWTRIVALGGLAKDDPRVNVAAGDSPPKDADQRRASRMQQVDLSGHASGWPTQAGSESKTGLQAIDNLLGQLTQGDAKEYLQPQAGSGIPVLLLDDPLAWAKDKAYAYQEAWREMEAYIADLANPNHTEAKQKAFPYAPWFDSAVLANRYFFVEQPDIEAEGLQKHPAEPLDRKLKKAKDQRTEWRKRLNLGDIQTALGTQHRAVLRERIKTAKQALVAILDPSHPEIDRLVAALDDWFHLPDLPQAHALSVDVTTAAHYGDAFALTDQLIARLGEHEYKLDNHLETEPLSESQLHELEKNDPGAKLLLALLSSAHPLYARLVPMGECAPAAEAGETGQTQIAANSETKSGEPYDPSFNPDKLFAVSRRAAQSLSAWSEHYAGVAAGQLEVQKSIVGYLSRSQLMPEITKASVPMKDYLLGKAPEGYEFLRVGALEVDKSISLKDALAYDGGDIKLSPNKSANLDLYTPDGTHFASTTLNHFKQGRGYSSRYWKRLRHGTKQWFEHTIEVWMVKTIKGAPAFAKSLVDTGIWTKTILPAVVLLEGWNLLNAIGALSSAYKDQKDTARPWVDFAGAVADSVAIAASINRARYDLAHHKAERLAGKQLDLSKQYARAIRWARGFGAGAGIYSAGLSIYDMMRNINEGDDAAIGHGVMASGFIIVTASELAGLTAAGSASVGVLGFLAGPAGWIGLAVIFTGAALLSWVFTEDTPLEEWLANGPFSQKEKPHLLRAPARYPQPGQEHERYVAPDGSQLLLSEEQRILRIGSVNSSFTQEEDGAIYIEQDDGRHLVGHIGEPLDLSHVADRSQRFAGFDESDEVDGKFHIWKVKPYSAYQSLLSAVYTPTGVLKVERHALTQPWRVELAVHIPQYIDNRSLLTIELLQTDRNNTYMPFYKQIYTITPDNGSGPRSISIIQPLRDQYGGKVKARIQIDLYGDKSVVLPMPEPSWSEADEQRRQQFLTEKRIAPIGQVNIADKTEKKPSSTAQSPALDKPIFLELEAGPPQDYLHRG